MQRYEFLSEKSKKTTSNNLKVSEINHFLKFAARLHKNNLLKINKLYRFFFRILCFSISRQSYGKFFNCAN